MWVHLTFRVFQIKVVLLSALCPPSELLPPPQLINGPPAYSVRRILDVLWFSGILWSNILVLVIPLPGAGLFGNSPACLPATAQRIHRKHSLWTLASGHLPGPL